MAGSVSGFLDCDETVRLLSEEQASLRRVAVLVAQGAPAAEIFGAVSEEVARLFGDDLAAIGKFDRDAPAITIVGRTNPVAGFGIGMRIELSDEAASATVYATGRPARSRPARAFDRGVAARQFASRSSRRCRARSSWKAGSGA